jgi:hypothetical protein
LVERAVLLHDEDEVVDLPRSPSACATRGGLADESRQIVINTEGIDRRVMTGRTVSTFPKACPFRTAAMRRNVIWGIGVVAALAAGRAFASPPADFAADQRIVYSDGLHSENTTMIRLGGRILLGFRGGEEGQIGSDRARINIFESRDQGRSFTLLSEVDAGNLPGGRDIRDPKLVEMRGRLFLYAISRLPGFHYRDLGGQAWAVRAESTDGGRTWTEPVKTYADGTGGGEMFWGSGATRHAPTSRVASDIARCSPRAIRTSTPR